MDYPKSVPGVGLVDGKFIDENTATGQVGSLIPSGWGNNVTDELLAVIQAGELEPDEADHSQLLQAIQAITLKAIPSAPGGATETEAGVLKLVSDLLLTEGVDDTRAVTTKKLVAKLRGQGFTAFTTNGAAPSFTLTPVPAITAYTERLRFRVKFNGAGNGANTLNISELGAKSIKQYDSTGAKVAAVFAANQLADVEYDGTDLIVLNPLASATIKPGDYGLGGVGVSVSNWNSSFAVGKNSFISGNASSAGGPGENMVVSGFNLMSGDMIGAQLLIYSGVNKVTYRQGYGSLSSWVELANAGANSSITSLTGLTARPSFSGNLAWDAGNFNPATKANKNTANLSASGWRKNGDTGELVQWTELLIGDLPGGGQTYNITWPTPFPTGFINAQISFKNNGTGDVTVQGSYGGATLSGCTVRINEWAQTVQPAGLTIVIEARGN